MQRFILTACAGLLAAAVASPSLAADLPRPVYKGSPAPIYVAPFSWTGFYVGINGGYGWGTSNWTIAGTGLSTGSFGVNGGLVGGTIGYNLQTGSWVWGLEADFDGSWIHGTETTFCGVPGCKTSNTWLATTRGRLGYAWDRWLPYITVGAAFGDIKMDPGFGSTQSKTKVGLALGTGVEYAFMGAWSAKIEYLYVDLGKATCSAATCVTAPISADTDVTFKSNMVRAGINYRF
jgi:outer membrane immunogenic protein